MHALYKRGQACRFLIYTLEEPGNHKYVGSARDAIVHHVSRAPPNTPWEFESDLFISFKIFTKSAT
jgi:hypothetical protein